MIRYEASDKHKPHGWGSPMDLSDEEAEELLNSKTTVWINHRALVAVYKRKRIYVFRSSGRTFHGYRVTGAEVHRHLPEVQEQVAELLGTTVKRLSRLRR
jgi:hypothetical protein